MTDRRTEPRSAYRYTLPIPVRWIDCDAYGHVNNAIYYAMMDQVVSTYIVETGVIAMGTSPSIGLCVASACDFHQSIDFPGTVDARLRVARLGGKSVRYEIGLYLDGIEAPAATGHFVHVYVDRHTRRPVSLTASQRDALAPLVTGMGERGMTDRAALTAFALDGKSAVVTGAATGIGRAVARLFHEAGATVIAADINAAALASLPDECPGMVCVPFDQGDPDSILELFAAVDAQVERLDVLINCAAIYPFKQFEAVDTALLDRMLAINLRGPFQCVQQAVARMKQGDRGGSIVNIASVNSLRACIFDNVHYGVGKAGVNNLTVSVALEYAPHNIRVNSILPGGVATEQAGRAVETHDAPLRGPFTQPGRMPLSGTSCEPEDIARACLFFASDASSYITGQLLAVDGGFLIS